MLWIDRPGAPWHNLPTRFGPWATLATRFYRWTTSATESASRICSQPPYQVRNRVERLINRFKQFRRIATRDETRAVKDDAMVTLAAILRLL